MNNEILLTPRKLAYYSIFFESDIPRKERRERIRAMKKHPNYMCHYDKPGTQLRFDMKPPPIPVPALVFGRLCKEKYEGLPYYDGWEVTFAQEDA